MAAYDELEPIRIPSYANLIMHTWRGAELAAIVHINPAAEVGLAVQHTSTKLTQLRRHACPLKPPCGLTRPDRLHGVV